MTIFKKRFQSLAMLVTAFAVVPALGVRAETYVFAVDPNNSSVTLGGFAEVVLFGVFPFSEQASGALTTAYSGTITVDLDDFQNPGTVSFLSADLVAHVNGQWQPNDGGTGLAPAGDGNYGIGTAFGVGKIRGLSFDLSSSAAATVTGGQFPSSTQVWEHKTGIFDIFSPALGAGNSQPLTAIAGNQVGNMAGNASISVTGNTATLTLPIAVTIGWGIPGSPTVLGDYVYTGTITATASVSIPDVVGNFVFHADWTGGGSNVDTGKFMHKQGAVPQQLTVENLINTAHGINGVGFQIQDFPNAAGLTAADFELDMSAQGAFGANPNWGPAPAPASVTVAAGTPTTVSIQWANNLIVDRWLRVTVKANANTGLASPQVFYLGHLRGETGLTDNTYTVAFADITPIRSAVGGNVGAGSVVDIDKNGTISFADISAMRSNVGSQLSNISVP